MKRIIGCMVILAALSGCEALMPQPPKERYRTIPAHWGKDGVTHDEMRTKLASCEYEVGINKILPNEQGRLIRACMMGEGFRWIPARTELITP